MLVLISSAAAQVAAPAGVAQVLPNLSRTAENARVDLARLRIEKWKTNGDNKHDAQERVQSLQRNLRDALPALIGAVQQNPQSSSAAFKLYRNVNVLYDVMSNLAEMAGAFGPKDEYASLTRELSQFDQERRALADQVEALTAQKDAEVARMQQAARHAQAEAADAPPKKIIIDDEAPVRKSKTKKKPAPPK